MAKGNMILGYLRGAIGDIVFWRAKGQQMARARNRAPANPRTEYQMTQRAKWANVAKFVKMAPPRFFKFAFEGKGVSLTDYNVFYRENILRSPMMSRTASANPAYPALGNFVMSRGSLPSIGALTEYGAVSLDTPFFKLAEGNDIVIPSDEGRTVAWLTTQLLTLNRSRYRVGDILTFVRISCDNITTPLVYPELSDYGYVFQYYQIVLSTADNALISSRLGGYARLNTLADNKILGISFGSTSGSAGAVEWSGDLKATCMIHTRKVSGGLLVSSEELIVNDNYALLTEQALTNSVYIQQVLTDWRSAETAILQGEEQTPFPRDPWAYVTKSVNVTFTNNESGTSLITHSVSRVTKNNIVTGGTKALDYSLCLDFETEDDAISVFNSTAGTSVSDTEKEVSIRAVYSSGKTFTDDAAVMQRTGATIIIDYSGNGNDYLILSGSITFDWYLDDVLVLSKAFAHADNVDIFEVYNTVTGSTYSWSDVISGKSTGQYLNLAVRAFNLASLINVSKYFKVTYNGLRTYEPTWSRGDYGIAYTNSWINIQSLPASLRLETAGAEYDNLEKIDVSCEITA